MVMTNFNGTGVGFGAGVGCGFGVGWGFGGYARELTSSTTYFRMCRVVGFAHNAYLSLSDHVPKQAPKLFSDRTVQKQVATVFNALKRNKLMNDQYFSLGKGHVQQSILMERIVL